MTTFNVFQPQNYQGGSLNRGIKHIEIIIDNNNGGTTSKEVAPLWSDYPFSPLHATAIEGNNLFTSCACQGFTGILKFDVTTGNIVSQFPLTQVGDLKISSYLFSFYTAIPDYRSNYREVGLTRIDPSSGIVSWDISILKGNNYFGCGYYVNYNDQLLLAGLLNNGVSSIVSFNVINGSSIPVTNSGFNFTGEIAVGRKDENNGFIVAYNNSSIVFAKYVVTRDSSGQNPSGITITPLQATYSFSQSVVYVEFNAETTDYPEGSLTVYTMNDQGVFKQLKLNLKNLTFKHLHLQATQGGTPYEIKVRPCPINGVPQDVVFVARTDQDDTVQDVLIIPELPSPVIAYFGDNQQANGIAIQ